MNADRSKPEYLLHAGVAESLLFHEHPGAAKGAPQLHVDSTELLVTQG